MPKAMIRIYLADGQFKSLVLDQNVTCDEAVTTIIEKLETTSTARWDDCLLFQSLDFGKEIIELNSVDCPYTIAQWWGEGSDCNRFIFKKPGEPLKKGITGFDKYKASRPERRSNNPVKARRSAIASSQIQSSEESFMVQQGAPPPQATAAMSYTQPNNSYSNPSGGASAPVPSVASRPPMGGFNPLAPNTSVPLRPSRPPPPTHQEDESVSRPPMERVPMPGFGGNVGGGMDPNALQEKIRNMKAQQNVQTESVKAWINMNLQEKSMVVNDLATDMKSGVALAALCEILTKKSLHYNANPRSDMQMKDNLEAAFKAFETGGVKATGAGPSDFLSGNQRAILGYLLLLVKKFKDARTSKRFSRVLTSSGPLITGRTSTNVSSPGAPASPSMAKPSAPVKQSIGSVKQAGPPAVKQNNPNSGRKMPTPPGKNSYAPAPAPAVPKKGSLPPVPSAPVKKSSLPPVPAPPTKQNSDELASLMDSLVVSLDSTVDEWGSSNNQNNDYSYDNQEGNNSWDTSNDNNYDYSGGNNDYGNTDYSTDYNTDYTGESSYDNNNYDYSGGQDASYDEPASNSFSGGNEPAFNAEDDPDLFDTFNELEDMLSEMANELGVFDS